MTPSSDTWVNTVRLEDNVFETEGNFEDVTRTAERRYGGFDPQTGLTPIIWGGWQTNWTGTRKESRVRKRKKEVSTGKSTYGKQYGLRILIPMKKQPQQRSKIHLLIHLEPEFNQEMVQDN